MERSPLCAVLRPPDLAWAQVALAQLEACGVRHVEIAWRPDDPSWVPQARQLRQAFPSLAFGAASACSPAALQAAVAAGFGYAVSPVLDPALLEQALSSGLLLVPGVMTPSEVHRARSLGCALVKLFPAAALGIDYWRQLRQPLGEPLPRCLAAGGLEVAAALDWLAAGVDAVALGSALVRDRDGLPVLDANLPGLMAALARRSAVDATA
ncbi:MAG: bifunctional 4-hydroxy-2-oxoglutarate aldolase/2-dehydro-3-deoxy-phosphogluconate aldolase [Prochlorococcaceae cyanobacterium]